MKYPPATRKDYERFCVIEGWTPRQSARGKGTHHVNYELNLPDGRTLYTRVSHPVDRSDYGVSMWSHILRDQLEVTPDEFWACVNDSRVPDRGVSPDSGWEAIPVGVVTTLIQVFHVPEDEVHSMTKAEAIQRLGECYMNQA